MKPFHLDTGMPSDCQRKLDNSELLLKTSNLVQKDMSDSTFENSLRRQTMEGDLQEASNTVMQTEAAQNRVSHSESTLSILTIEDQALLADVIDQMHQNNVKLQSMPDEISDLTVNALTNGSSNEGIENDSLGHNNFQYKFRSAYPNLPPQGDQSLLRTALSEPMKCDIKAANGFSVPSSQQDCLILNGDGSPPGQTIDTNFQSPTHGQMPTNHIDSLSPTINPLQKESPNDHILQDMLNRISPTVSNTGTGVSTPNHEFLIQSPIQRTDQPELTLMQQVENSLAERDTYCEFRQPRPPDLPQLTSQPDFIQQNSGHLPGYVNPVGHFPEPAKQSPQSQAPFTVTNQDGFLQLAVEPAFNQPSSQDDFQCNSNQESFMQMTSQTTFSPTSNEGDLVTINPSSFLQASNPSTFIETSSQGGYQEADDQTGFMSIGSQSAGQDLNSIGASFQDGQQNFSSSLFSQTSAQPILANMNHTSINVGISSPENITNTGLQLISGGPIMSEVAQGQGFLDRINADALKMDNIENTSSNAGFFVPTTIAEPVYGNEMGGVQGYGTDLHSAEFPDKIHLSQSENNRMLTAVPQNIEEHAMQNTDALPSFGTNIPNHLLMTDFSGVNLNAFHDLDSPNSLSSPSFGCKVNGPLSPPQHLRNHLLSDDIDIPSSPSSVSSIDRPSSPTPISSPCLDTSTNTQLTLTNRSRELCLDDTFSSTTDGSMSNVMEPSLWQMAGEPAMDCMIFTDRGPFTSLSMKVPSTLSSINMSPVTVKIEEPVFKVPDSDRPPGLLALAESAEVRANENATEKIRRKPAERSKSNRNTSRRMKEETLNMQFPSKADGCELRIVEQPEDQHRARYLTEGSRGTVKDKSGNGFPMVKLLGVQDPATLQVFVGNDSGKVKPHGFYQACKVCGKNSTPCIEEKIDGTTVIEIPLTPANDMTSRIDCVGILKLRNADVEQRIGLTKSKKKSTKTRLVFRVMFQKPDGNHATLQIPSAPILCTQPIGVPEICRMSLEECSVEGKQELFIIGKNLKSSKVFLQELTINGGTLWEQEAQIDTDFLHTTHLICTIPEYSNKRITEAVSVQIIVRCGGKVSEPMPFKYTPIRTAVKLEIPMETDCVHKATTFTAAPDALKLNEMIQQMPQNGIFQMPVGALSTSIVAISNTVDMVTDSILNNSPAIPQQPPFAESPACIFSTPLVSSNATEPNLFLRNLLSGDTNQSS